MTNTLKDCLMEGGAKGIIFVSTAYRIPFGSRLYKVDNFSQVTAEKDSKPIEVARMEITYTYPDGKSLGVTETVNLADHYDDKVKGKIGEIK